MFGKYKFRALDQALLQAHELLPLGLGQPALGLGEAVWLEQPMPGLGQVLGLAILARAKLRCLTNPEA